MSHNRNKYQLGSNVSKTPGQDNSSTQFVRDHLNRISVVDDFRSDDDSDSEINDFHRRINLSYELEQNEIKKNEIEQAKLAEEENPPQGFWRRNWDRFVAFYNKVDRKIAETFSPVAAASIAGGLSGFAGGATVGALTGIFVAIPTLGLGYIPTIIVFGLIGGAIGSITGFVTGKISNRCAPAAPDYVIRNKPLIYDKLDEVPTPGCFSNVVAYFDRKVNRKGVSIGNKAIADVEPVQPYVPTYR